MTCGTPSTNSIPAVNTDAAFVGSPTHSPATPATPYHRRPACRSRPLPPSRRRNRRPAHSLKATHTGPAPASSAYSRCHQRDSTAPDPATRSPSYHYRLIHKNIFAACPPLGVILNRSPHNCHLYRLSRYQLRRTVPSPQIACRLKHCRTIWGSASCRYLSTTLTAIWCFA